MQIENITLYSNDCPKCKILKVKLDDKNISYNICSDTEKMISKGFTSVPMLEVNNIVYNFNSAIQWVLKNG